MVQPLQNLIPNFPRLAPFRSYKSWLFQANFDERSTYTLPPRQKKNELNILWMVFFLSCISKRMVSLDGFSSQTKSWDVDHRFHRAPSLAMSRVASGTASRP